MADNNRNLVNQLSHLVLSLRAQLDQAEARVPDINALVTQLAELGVLNDAITLGLVIYEGHYSVHTGPHDSGQVVQAALKIPGGFGVIYWDSEEYVAFRQAPPRCEAELLLRFLPFEECPPAIKALLLPQVHPLLVMLLMQFRIPRPPRN